MTPGPCPTYVRQRHRPLPEQSPSCFDPVAMQALIDHRVPVNPAIEHTEAIPGGVGETFTLGMLGIINGMCTDRGQRVAACYTIDHDLGLSRLTGFQYVSLGSIKQPEGTHTDEGDSTV